MLRRVIRGGLPPAPTLRSVYCLLAAHLVTTTVAPLVRLTSSAAVYILSVEDNVVKPCEEIERTLRRDLPELRRRFKVRRIGIFGSVVRGEQRGRSDLDILVEYSETPSVLAIVALKRHLTELTGEKVDLVPASALKPAYRQTILNEVVYA
jgi:predicted nucleotidyltransferase